jgi:tripartite-type tricarboxylate transporter receptor subunit TctC
MRKIMMAAVVALVTVAGAVSAHAQAAWPTKPVRLILPTVPGGGTDNLARLLQNSLAAKFGQPVLIENRPGGAYIVATEMVVRGDDHTIGMIVVNTHAANPSVQKKLPYDSVKDISPIILLTSSPNVIAVHPGVQANTLPELIALAKAKPGSLFYGTSGIASGQHFAGETLKMQANIDIVHVPYKGTGASLTDAISGQIPVIFANVISGRPHIVNGKLRAIAVTSAQRSPMLPDVPTVAEQGYPSVDVVDSYGIVGPAHLSPEIVKKIHDAFAEAMTSEELKPRLLQQGIYPRLMAPAEFKKFIEAEIVTLREIAQKANITGEQ